MAVTRARRHIAVVCDTQTVQNHPFLKSLIDHMTRRGEVRTAFEYIADVVPQNYTHGRSEGKGNPSATKQGVKDQPPPKAKQGKKPPTGGGGGVNAANEKRHSPTETTPVKGEEDGNRYSEIKKQVELFLKDLDQTELQFPASFSSHDRLLVHQAAEELGLTHESTGEGKDRHITVSRPARPVPAQQQLLPEEEVRLSPSAARQEPPSGPELDLKGLHLERMKREQQKREENSQQRRQQSKPPPASSAKKKKSAKGQ